MVKASPLCYIIENYAFSISVMFDILLAVAVGTKLHDVKISSLASFAVEEHLNRLRLFHDIVNRFFLTKKEIAFTILSLFEFAPRNIQGNRSLCLR